MDYALQPMTNCCLINLKDMLDNGTVINGKKINSPHKFLTACTIATQIILGVSSSQYGGCTISLTHLAPYLRKSKESFEKKYRDYGLDEKKVKELTEIDLKQELASGVQTFNYQINSMSNSNGQSPFITVFSYLGEDKEYTEEIAMITEEFFKQRIRGMENEQNVRITQEFPKLIYVLEEDNIHTDSKYYWLTELAAKCTAKRFVPDYVSEKKMKELKEGNCFPSMGL
jgi:ribonucleoside-triphosphate reductase